MENCVKFKYLESINNDSLVKLGHGRIKFLGDTAPNIVINATTPPEGEVVTIIGDGVFTDNNQKTHAYPMQNVNPSTGGYELDFNKYLLSNIQLANPSGASAYNDVEACIEDFQYNDKLLSIRFRSSRLYGNINCFAGKTFALQAFDVLGSDITGDIGSLLNAFDNSTRLKAENPSPAAIRVASTKLTGVLKPIIDHIASFAISGSKLVVGVNTAIDITGLEIDNTHLWLFTFDGNGGYTVEQVVA